MALSDFLKKPRLGCLIEGELLEAPQREATVFISPATGQAWKAIATAAPTDTQRAIESAQNAFKQWKEVPAPIRGGIVRKMGDIMLDHRDALAEVMAMEMGKPLKDGIREVSYAAGFFHWFAGEAERIYGKTVPSQFSNKRLMVLHEPVGVCGVITPWNFPLAMGARKIAAALAAGCSIVAKPSSETPVSMLAMGVIGLMAGLPQGAFNVVIGPEQEIGQVLLESPLVRKISFTGSTEVGRYLYRESAKTLKKLSLELGGHAPVIVFRDAHLDKAVAGCITAKFRNTGQTCVSPNRFFVQKGIYEAFLEKFIEEVKKLKVGNPLDSATDLSDVLHPQSITKMKNHIDDALKKGATGMLMGKEPFYPTILSGLNRDMLVFHEETFGPLAAIMPFETVEEGIALANDTHYGLASYAFTQSLATAQAVMDQLEFGIIGLNDGLPSTPQASFGGIKNSGFGREGGPSGINEYLVEKFVSISF